ncbi:integrase, catalytic region, zinc finger, CCHC-type containing protein [Tanacetum coccineum]
MMHMLSPKPDSFYHTEHKMAIGYENPHYLKQAQKKQQSFYNGKVLLDKHDPPAVYDSKETLQLTQESCLKMKQLNKEIKPANYAKINTLLEVVVSQKAKSHEELYFLNTSKMASVSNTVSKPILIPHDGFSDNTSSPSVAQKFLNEVKDTIVTLQQAAKFVGDFKAHAKEADESLGMNKVLEYENERLLRAVVSQDIMSIVQNNSVVDTSNLQTKLERIDNTAKTKRPLLGNGDLQWGNILIARVYFVEGLGHNMFSVGQFCDSDLESWLWHQRLSHLNFDTINDLAKTDLVTGLLKFKYSKEHISKDEAPEEIKTFLKKIQVLQAPVIITSSVKTPQQNGVVERRNQTLVEAARTMLIFLVLHYSYGLKRLLQRATLRTNNREDIGRLSAKGDIGFFIGYSATSCAYRVYNRRTRKIMERMNVTFDELSAMSFEQHISKPVLQGMTYGHISSRLDLTYAPSTITSQNLTKRELDLLFEAIYDDYISGQPSDAARTAHAAPATQNLQTLNASTTTADSAPTPTNSSSQASTIPNTSQDVDELQQQHVQQ